MAWSLNPWQTLLWIIGLELLSLPLIVWAVNAVIEGYFRAKQKHIGKMADAFGTALNAMAETFKNKSRQQVNDIFEKIKNIDLHTASDYKKAAEENNGNDENGD